MWTADLKRKLAETTSTKVTNGSEDARHGFNSALNFNNFNEFYREKILKTDIEKIIEMMLKNKNAHQYIPNQFLQKGSAKWKLNFWEF